MAYPAYIREHARKLRVERHLSIDEIAERLALPKTTVFYWVKDLPLGRERRWSFGQQRGNEAMRAKYKRLRDDAYARGWTEYDELASHPTFRDFVVLYIAEGYKRNRNTVSIANSDERIIAMATGWMRRLGQREPATWRSEHGVMEVALYDTMLRARLQAWIDRVRSDWELDSASNLGA